MTDNAPNPYVVVVTGAQSAGRTTLLRHYLAELNLHPREVLPAAVAGPSLAGSDIPEVRS
jgi:uridine kinase